MSDQESLNYLEMLEVEKSKRTIVWCFMQAVKHHPDKVAVVYESISMTYRELDTQSDQVAWYLSNKGIKTEDIIAICMERGIEEVVYILGIWKAGAAFVFLEPTFPAERNELCIRECNCKIVLEQKDLAQIIQTTTKDKFIDRSDRMCLATIIYTSGSTGKPKGVMIEHQNIMASASNYKELGYCAEDRVCIFAGFVFVAAVYDLSVCLLTGATMYIIPRLIRKSIREIVRYFERFQITVSFLPPHMAVKFMEYDESIKSLRLLIVGSEPSRNLTKKPYRIINVYASSETCAMTSYYDIKDSRKSYPIGHIVPGLKYYILDENGRKVPKGKTGELCLSGRQITRGYIGNEKQTKEQYESNPFEYLPEYAKLFHTRDMVKVNDLGELVFVGRKDSMFKIRGFRVEALSVENHMLEYEGIREVHVTAFMDDGGTNILFGFFIADRPIDTGKFREFLSKKIPCYCIPWCLIQMKDFPRLVNGKIDQNSFLPPCEINDHKKLELLYH